MPRVLKNALSSVRCGILELLQPLVAAAVMALVLGPGLDRSGRVLAAPQNHTHRGVVGGSDAWVKSVAYGAIHPEDCLMVVYNPTIRLLVAMGMLLFPIVFFVLYQYCCAGDHVCDCCRRKKTTAAAVDATGQSLSSQMKQFVGNQQKAKAYFQEMAAKAHMSVHGEGPGKKQNPLVAAVLQSHGTVDPARTTVQV